MELYISWPAEKNCVIFDRYISISTCFITRCLLILWGLIFVDFVRSSYPQKLLHFNYITKWLE